MSAETVEGIILSFQAENALSEKYVCVELGTDDNEVDLPDTAHEKVLGITQDTAAAAQAISVMVSGKSRAVASAAITKGDYVVAEVTTGRIKTAPAISSTWTGTASSTEHVIGLALESASAAGEIISILIRPVVITH